MMKRTLSAFLGNLLFLAPVIANDAATSERPPLTGTVHFVPQGDQESIPQRYRLEDHTFSYEMWLEHDLPNSSIEIYHVRYPSPVVTDCPDNNNVHAEYYRP